MFPPPPNQMFPISGGEVIPPQGILLGGSPPGLPEGGFPEIPAEGISLKQPVNAEPKPEQEPMPEPGEEIPSSFSFPQGSMSQLWNVDWIGKMPQPEGGAKPHPPGWSPPGTNF